MRELLASDTRTRGGIVKNVKVGDTVIVEHSRYRPTDEVRTSTGRVTKVARKYFTVEFRENFSGTGTYTRTWEDQYAISDGRQRSKDPNYTSYRDRAYTPDGYEADLARQEVLRKIRQEHKAYGDSGGTMSLNTWSDGHLVELLHLLDRVREYNAQTDLDR